MNRYIPCGSYNNGDTRSLMTMVLWKDKKRVDRYGGREVVPNYLLQIKSIGFSIYINLILMMNPSMISNWKYSIFSTNISNRGDVIFQIPPNHKSLFHILLMNVCWDDSSSIASILKKKQCVIIRNLSRPPISTIAWAIFFILEFGCSWLKYLCLFVVYWMMKNRFKCCWFILKSKRWWASRLEY